MATKKFNNPPPFRATGRGYYNRIPNLVATNKNSNVSLVNLGKDLNDEHRVIYLFCTGIQTGWQVAGSYGQSPRARTFYPMNLSQDEFMIEGIVANQYEYDRVVEFVIAHHQTAVDVRNPRDSIATSAVMFTSKPYRVEDGRDRNGNINYRTISSGIRLDGYITGIQAGHQRFVNAPTYQMSMRIANDYLQKQIQIEGDFNKELVNKYLVSFGQFYKSPKIKALKGGQPPTTDTSGTNTGTVFFGPNPHGDDPVT